MAGASQILRATDVLGDKLRVSAAGRDIVALWNLACARCNPIVAITTVWAAVALPLVWLHSYGSDEGLAVSIARTAVDDGYWITPHFFNVRVIERPALLSWIIAAISEPFGHVSQVTAHLPIALFLLLGCLLIYFLLRKLAASVPASLLGTMAFLACPMVMRSYVMATADMPLAVLLFLAFVVWWDGFAGGRISVSRWICVGIVLLLAGLMKGPQPIAYFALGIGLFVLITRQWKQLPGLLLAGAICAIPLAAWYAHVYIRGDESQWANFMRVQPAVQLAGPIEAVVRLFFEILPAALIALMFPFSKQMREKSFARPAFPLALACYAFTASIVVLFWPGGSTARYYFPMVLPLCVFGGLAYDVMSKQRPPLAAAFNLVVTATLIVYALVYSLVAAPLLPAKFRPTEIDAARITPAIQAAPAPIYRIGVSGLNLLPYVPGRIIGVAAPSVLETIQGPAWIIVSDEQARGLLSHRPSDLHLVMPVGEDDLQLLRLD
jgi:4-amino-4-deoxy-L-arabinose transferase-like glycosyltransferase